MADNVNAISQRLVQAIYGLDPRDQGTRAQKQIYTKLFLAANRLLSSYMDRYGLDIQEAAGHLEKADITRLAGLDDEYIDRHRSQEPLAVPDPPKATPTSDPEHRTHARNARDLRSEFKAVTGRLPPYPRSHVALRQLREELDRYINDQAQAHARNYIIDLPIPEKVKERLLLPLQPEKYQPRRQVKLMDTKPPLSKDELATFLARIKEVEAQRQVDIEAQRQGEKDFKDEFFRLGQMDVIDDFDLDLPTSAGELEGEPGRLLSRAKGAHRREGAYHVYSTWRTEAVDSRNRSDVIINDRLHVVDGILVTDNTMKADMAVKLLQHLDKSRYLIKVKFLREQEPDVWVVEDGFEPLKEGRTRGGGVLEISNKTLPGLLEGLDQLYYHNAYPVAVVVYGLYRIRDPHPANLAPMRDGDLNCVAQRVVEHYEGALRGQGLTATRRHKIEEWEVRVHDTGATVGDVAELEKILKRSIIIRDIAGEDIFNSGKYQLGGNGVRGKVELILHNGHAWGAELHFPQSREVNIYEGDVWRAIREATQGEATAVWVLGSGDRRLSVDQFVLVDGRTYRTQEKQLDLEKACSFLDPENAKELSQKVFSENHAASVVAKERNGWKPTPVHLLEEVQASCVEHGHGGLWNAESYDTRDVVAIDMKACYPASFQGHGEAAPWFKRFGHPGHRMTKVSINGPLPPNIGTGFAFVRSWEFAPGCHPVVPAWFGRHIAAKGWVPTQLLAYLYETGLLAALEVTEVILAFKTQKEVWLPNSRDQACSVIGKFTQGSKGDGKRLTRRLVRDEGELDYLIRDTRHSGTLVGAPERCPLGWVITYYDGSQPQYTHLRASMLAYAHINMIEMLRRFTSDEVVRVATDSVYIQKDALHKLKGVEAYVPLDAPTPERVSPAQWRDKGEFIHAPQEHAAYLPLPEYWVGTRETPNSDGPSYGDPLSRHQLSYLNGGGGSGKTTRAIELYRARKPLVLTPTHRLAKAMRKRGVEAQTYHSFFRWSGQNDWTPERMGQKFVPRVIIWDEVCTVPQAILETFLDWLEGRGVQVICCGDQGQPPPIGGEAPHDWLREHADYHEEITVDHRAKCPELRALKRAIRLRSDKVQCKEMRKALPSCRGWNDFTQVWHPHDLLLVSRKAPRDRAQQQLFSHHKQAFPNEPVPLLYRPKDTRKQNVLVTIPGPLPKQEELVLNDVVEVPVQYAQEAIEGRWGDHWTLGYAMTVHSSQGLTIEDPQKVWIVDDFLQWSNLAYLAVSRVQYLHQLARCCPPPEADVPPYDEVMARRNIGRKLQSYKRVDAAKGLTSNLRMKDVEALKVQQGNRCAACNISLLWCYTPKDTRQFSIDRIDNSQGHTRDNVRLTCLECNRKRGMSSL